MSDFRDILGIGAAPSAGQPQDKLKKADKLKKPDGVSREVSPVLDCSQVFFRPIRKTLFDGFHIF
jgi:hypothetical protein